MIRKTLTILSLIGFLLSVGAWGVSYYRMVWVLPTLRHRIELSRGAVTLQSLTAPTMPDEWLRSARQELANRSAPPSVYMPVGATHGTTSVVSGATTISYTYFYPGHRIDGFQSLNTLWTFSNAATADFCE